MPTLENKKKIRYLSRYRELDSEINRLLEERSRWESLATKITPTLSPTPGGGSGSNPIEKAVEKIVETENEIDMEIDRLQDLRKETLEVINQVRDESLKLLMKYRYIDGLTWEQIAVKMYFTYQWVCILHGKALSQITVDSN